MIARTAYVQLRCSPLLLALCLVGLAATFIVPPLAAIAGHGAARVLGVLAWGALAWSYLPTLRRFRLSAWWAPFLPAVAVFYMAATLGSALNHHFGRGVAWKGRAYRGAERMIQAGASQAGIGHPGVEAWSGKDRGDENFPVGSLLIRRDLRRHVHAFYVFARNADDIADSPVLSPTDKIARLDAMEDVLLGRRDVGSPSALLLRASLAGRASRRGTPATCWSPSAAMRPDGATRTGRNCRTTAATRRCRWGGTCWTCTARITPPGRRRTHCVPRFRC